ncbi:protein kinase family protein [Evansella sp. AB-rgal1]|uniref:protein kinase domain-containing protein n=1 Tax=Evansella sp. AB-rgal1 TaxID=3242696 RepID=UPI00359E1B67
MRDSISKKQECKLIPNQRVVGKWHRNSYRIIRQLGYGATGTVYLAEGKEGLVALKIASDSMSITSEVNVLRQFSKVQGPNLGPSFIDTDDYVSVNGVYPFYIMEYIQGEEFLPFIRQKGVEWVGILIIQLLKDLQELHQSGWVFGDLKPENLLVSQKPFQVRWLDAGGMTRVGRSIKEYTEFFDRGYWGLGSRKAEPSYDLFSVSMLFINRAFPSRFEKDSSMNPTQLLTKFKEKEELKAYEPIFKKGIEGKYSSANEMRNELIALIKNTSFSPKPLYNNSGSTKTRKRNKVKKQKESNKKRFRLIGLMESMLVGSFLLFLYILYLFGQTV